MDLGRGEAHARRILHGLHHVGDEAADFRRAGVVDRGAALQQHRVAHAGDLQNGHVPSVRGHRNTIGHRREPWYRPALPAVGWSDGGPWCAFPSDGDVLLRGEGGQVQVLVRDNNVDQALKALKKKMQREGIFREMKLRRHYEKPSERRAREAAEAVRRARKLERKRLEREGF